MSKAGVISQSASRFLWHPTPPIAIVSSRRCSERLELVGVDREHVDRPASRGARQLHVEALDALLAGRIVAIVRARDWELFAAVARLAENDAPTDLAFTDPALFRAWREAVTRWHLKGWTGAGGRLEAAIAADRR